MAGRLGALTVYLNANSGGLERGLSKASSMLKKFAAAAGGYLAVTSLKDLAKESLNLAGVQEKAENMLTRQLRNTQGMAAFTAGELKRYAGEVQSMSIFGDEKVMEAQRALLQMNSVTGEAFRKTRSVAVDIASATGQDLTAVMQSLGKAMQDPVKGLKQMREYGTDPAMKTAVEARLAAEGKEAAQLLILEDLQRRYAGAAEEAANTISGKMIQNQNALGDLKEGIGFLIDEIFDVRGALDTTGGWFATWATYLRDHAAEIGYVFKDVWIDIKAGAQKLYAFVAPVINQIASMAEAAIRNVVQFYQAIPKLLNGEDFQMQFFKPTFTLIEEYKRLGETLDQLDRDQAAAHQRLDKGLTLKLAKKAEQDIARGAAKGAEAGTEKGIKAAEKSKFDAPSAILGSSDAWSIIMKSMQFKQATAAAAASASSGSAEVWPSAVPIEPVMAAASTKTAAPKTPGISASPASSSTVKGDAIKRLTSETVTLRPDDIRNTVKDIASLIPQVTLARAVLDPKRLINSVQLAASPMAQQESVGTRALMAVASLWDNRNNGVRNAASINAPISREEVAAARADRDKKLQQTSEKQLTVLQGIRSGLSALKAEAANLFGGF